MNKQVKTEFNLLEDKERRQIYKLQKKLFRELKISFEDFLNNTNVRELVVLSLKRKGTKLAFDLLENPENIDLVARKIYNACFTDKYKLCSTTTFLKLYYKGECSGGKNIPDQLTVKRDHEYDKQSEVASEEELEVKKKPGPKSKTIKLEENRKKKEVKNQEGKSVSESKKLEDKKLEADSEWSKSKKDGSKSKTSRCIENKQIKEKASQKLITELFNQSKFKCNTKDLAQNKIIDHIRLEKSYLNSKEESTINKAIAKQNNENNPEHGQIENSPTRTLDKFEESTELIPDISSQEIDAISLGESDKLKYNDSKTNTFDRNPNQMVFIYNSKSNQKHDESIEHEKTVAELGSNNLVSFYSEKQEKSKKRHLQLLDCNYHHTKKPKINANLESHHVHSYNYQLQTMQSPSVALQMPKKIFKDSATQTVNSSRGEDNPIGFNKKQNLDQKTLLKSIFGDSKLKQNLHLKYEWILKKYPDLSDEIKEKIYKFILKSKKCKCEFANRLADGISEVDEKNLIFKMSLEQFKTQTNIIELINDSHKDPYPKLSKDDIEKVTTKIFEYYILKRIPIIGLKITNFSKNSDISGKEVCATTEINKTTTNKQFQRNVDHQLSLKCVKNLSQKQSLQSSNNDIYQLFDHNSSIKSNQQFPSEAFIREIENLEKRSNGKQDELNLESSNSSSLTTVIRRSISKTKISNLIDNEIFNDPLLKTNSAINIETNAQSKSVCNAREQETSKKISNDISLVDTDNISKNETPNSVLNESEIKIEHETQYSDYGDDVIILSPLKNKTIVIEDDESEDVDKVLEEIMRANNTNVIENVAINDANNVSFLNAKENLEQNQKNLLNVKTNDEDKLTEEEYISNVEQNESNKGETLIESECVPKENAVKSIPTNSLCETFNLNLYRIAHSAPVFTPQDFQLENNSLFSRSPLTRLKDKREFVKQMMKHALSSEENCITNAKVINICENKGEHTFIKETNSKSVNINNSSQLEISPDIFVCSGDSKSSKENFNNSDETLMSIENISVSSKNLDPLRPSNNHELDKKNKVCEETIISQLENINKLNLTLEKQTSFSDSVVKFGGRSFILTDKLQKIIKKRCPKNSKDIIRTKKKTKSRKQLKEVTSPKNSKINPNESFAPQQRHKFQPLELVRVSRDNDQVVLTGQNFRKIVDNPSAITETEELSNVVSKMSSKDPNFRSCPVKGFNNIY